jgi:hypothetical protein
MKKQENILRLISSGHDLKLKASDGSRLICEATDVFKHISSNCIKLGINKPGIATPEILPDVHEMVSDGTFMDIFLELLGNWNEKWLSQDKVVDFCETFPHWLNQKGLTVFLLKRDENKPIDEMKPGDNLVVVRVLVDNDDLYVSAFHLEDANVWHGVHRHRVVSPQFPLIK